MIGTIKKIKDKLGNYIYPVTVDSAVYMEDGTTLRDSLSNVKPCCRVYNNANQSITTAIVTALSFNLERYDNSNIHDLVTNPTRLTVPKTGLYRITGHVTFDSNATGIRAIYIAKLGTTTIATVSQNANVGVGTSMNVTTTINLVEGDYVELKVFHNVGSNLNVLSSNAYSPEFMMEYVGSIA